MNLTLSTTVTTDLSPQALRAALANITNAIQAALPDRDLYGAPLDAPRTVQITVQALAGRALTLPAPDEAPPDAGRLPAACIPPPERRHPKSSALLAARKACERAGWIVLQRAHPDFWLVRPASGQVCALTVAASRGRRPKAAKRALLAALARLHSIPVASYSPDAGFARLCLADPVSAALPDKVTSEDRSGSTISPQPISGPAPKRLPKSTTFESKRALDSVVRLSLDGSTEEFIP